MVIILITCEKPLPVDLSLTTDVPDISRRFGNLGPRKKPKKIDWGEGDPRWIVEERADAHNVNNWHWRESDATQWSKTKFKELLVGLKIQDEDVGSCSITEVASCDGEASVSNRKNKIICFYEWSIKLKWKGQTKDNSKTWYKGEALIPNLSEEYDADEVDVEIKVGKEDLSNDRLVQVMKSLGVVLIRAELDRYVKSLRTEYSAQLILPPKDAKPIAKPTTNVIKNEMNKMTMNEQNNVTGVQKNTGTKIITKKLTMNETFMTTVEELFDTFCKKERVEAWSRSKVSESASVGTTMSLFDKNVEVEFTELVKNEKISMKWRLKSWIAAHYSSVTLSFKQTSSGAQITLEQSGIPENSVEATTQGWKRYYWNAIKMTFGFGANIM